MEGFNITARAIHASKREFEPSVNSKRYKIGEILQNTRPKLIDLVTETLAVQEVIYGALEPELAGFDKNTFLNAIATFYACEAGLERLVQGDGPHPNGGSSTQTATLSFENVPTSFRAELLSLISDVLVEEHGKAPENSLYDIFTRASELALDALDMPEMNRYMQDTKNLKMLLQTTVPVEFEGLKKKGKQAANLDIKKPQTYSRDYLGGIPEILEYVDELVWYMAKGPEWMAKYGGVRKFIPSGILLYGIPGTGKTTLVRVLGAEANAELREFDSGDFGDIYKDGSQLKFRRKYEECARAVKQGRNEFVLMFIDEFDSVARSRNDSRAEEAKIVTSLNTHLDGVHYQPGVVVVGATNCIEKLELSLIRPRRMGDVLVLGVQDDGRLSYTWRVLIDRANDGFVEGYAIDPNVDIDKLVEASSNEEYLASVGPEEKMLVTPGVITGKRLDDLKAAASMMASGKIEIPYHSLSTGASIETMIDTLIKKKLRANLMAGKEYEPLTQAELVDGVYEIMGRER